MHRRDKDRSERTLECIHISSLFPLRECQFEDTDACSNFCNNAFVSYSHSKLHHTSVIAQSSIKMTRMTHIISFAVKMKSKRTPKRHLIMILW